LLLQGGGGRRGEEIEEAKAERRVNVGKEKPTRTTVASVLTFLTVGGDFRESERKRVASGKL
jgi:hypothetical protein